MLCTCQDISIGGYLGNMLVYCNKNLDSARVNESDFSGGFQTCQNTIWCQWCFLETDAGSVFHSREDGWKCRDAADFANTFHTKGAFRVVAFYENRNNLRMVISGWEHILVEAGIIEAFAFFVGHFLTDSPADTLKDAPLYLTFAQAWINNLADIMGGSNFENFDKTKFHIHFDFCGLSGERQTRNCLPLRCAS